MEDGADVVFSLVAEVLVLLDVVLTVVSAERYWFDLLHCEIFIKQDRQIADEYSADWHA